jgi:signal transduction histidine kinase
MQMHLEQKLEDSMQFDSAVDSIKEQIHEVKEHITPLSDNNEKLQHFLRRMEFTMDRESQKMAKYLKKNVTIFNTLLEENKKNRLAFTAPKDSTKDLEALLQISLQQQNEALEKQSSMLDIVQELQTYITETKNISQASEGSLTQNGKENSSPDVHNEFRTLTDSVKELQSLLKGSVKQGTIDRTENEHSSIEALFEEAENEEQSLESKKALKKLQDELLASKQVIKALREESKFLQEILLDTTSKLETTTDDTDVESTSDIEDDPDYKPTVLVVDDSTTNRNVMKGMLEKNNFFVLTAEDGEEAIVSTQDIVPELVLLDINMPGMDGFEVCERLKADPLTEQVTVMFISGQTDVEAKIQGFKVGGVDYVTKPFQEEEFVARVRLQYRLKMLQKQQERSMRRVAAAEKKARNLLISEQVKNEELQEANDEIMRQQYLLEEQSREIELQNTTLQETNLKLTELGRFKDAMTGMIVHDLKNPLNSVINFAQMEMTPQTQESVLQSGKQMLNLVMNILDVQKFEDTNVQVETTPHQALKLVTSALSQVTLLYRQKSLKITNAVAEDIGVDCDFELMERVIVNLLTNAIKYTPVNGTISFNTELIEYNEEPDDDEEETTVTHWVKISLSDTGQGIPKEKVGSIFEKFSQVEAKKSGGTRSTGLGLTFCKMVVEAHGGQIWAESELGEGTTFFFILPYVQLEGDQIEIQADEITSQDNGNTSIELSDDNKKQLLSVVENLQEIPIYNLGGILDALMPLEPTEVEQIIAWKTELETAVYSGNEERYQELLESVKE